MAKVLESWHLWSNSSRQEWNYEEWFIKDGYSAIPIMSYKRFREFLSGVR